MNDKSTLTIRTPYGVEWEYSQPKSGGVNQAGPLGGIYINKDGEKCLVKKEPHCAKNIAEFLGSVILQDIVPDNSARVELVNHTGVKLPDENGSDVYVASIFIKDYKCDLFVDVFESINEPIPKERPKLLGMVFKGPLNKAFEKEKYEDFPKVTIPSLLTQNFDMHSGNIGVQKLKNGKKRLVTFDLAASFKRFDPEVHPHSDSRHLPGFGPTNHFKDYNEELKINSEFVAELDRESKHDFSKAFDRGFKEISTFYGVTAIKEFGVHIGISPEKLQTNDKDKLVGNIKSFMKETMVSRQKDLARFSAQIKADLCVKKDSKGHWQLGSYTDVQGNQVSFRDVVIAHKDYFTEIFNDEKHFKFRRQLHKNSKSELYNIVRDQAAAIIADEIMKGNIAVGESTFPNRNFDAIYEALKSGTVKLSDIIGTTPQLKPLHNYKSLYQMALSGELKQENSEIIRKLILQGSNPNLALPDGSRIIDHCKDPATISLLISFGAHDSKGVMKKHESAFREEYSKHTSAIHTAFKEGVHSEDLEAIKGLMLHHKQVLNDAINIGQNRLTPLDYAVLNGKTDVVKLLVEAGADINSIHSQGTALHIAVQQNNAEITKILLENGANPHLKHQGKTPLDLMKESKNPEISKESERFETSKKIVVGKHTSRLDKALNAVKTQVGIA